MYDTRLLFYFSIKIIIILRLTKQSFLFSFFLFLLNLKKKKKKVELHPYHPQTELISYCKVEGIQLQAYASLGGQDAGDGKLKPLGGPLLKRSEVLMYIYIYIYI
jgi:hypothetical protein